tara:strand:+ start:25886 stop:27118 length:1233 start_codon:yes stop_codon:yes gene_type:complete
MKIWIVEVGEPLPLKGCNNRPYRYSQLFDKLSSRGHDVTWWASNFSHQHKEKIISDTDEIILDTNKSIRLINMPAYKSNLSIMRVVSQAITGVRFYRAISNENPPDLIVSAYPVMEMAFFSVFFSYKKRIPVLVDVQDLWPDIFLGVKNSFKKMLVSTFIYPFRLLAKYTFRNASGIVGVSKDYMEFGLKYSDRNISDNDAIFPLAYAKDNSISVIGSIQESIDSNKTIIWFVGSFGSTYDLSTVIKTASNFEAKGIDDVVFVITGDGDSFSTIKNESYGLKNVILTGWLSLPQINYIGENASIGLMTYSEGAPQGLPNKVIEYMSFGLPMVCSLTGESKDLIAGSGIGFQYIAGDADSLHNCITKLLDEKIRKSMSEKAQQLFETGYSSEIVYDKYCNYIESFSSSSGL